MTNLEIYKARLLTEIIRNKEMLILMGYDWPSIEPDNSNSLNELEEFYAEIMGFATLHNFIAKNYPHTSGR